MQSVVTITKALASEPRLRILMALRRRRVCESVLTEMLGLAPATVSKHLWLLQQAGLVDSEKTGRCVCYSLVSAKAGNAVSHTLRWLRECLAGNALVRGDAERAETLLKHSSVQRQCRQFRRRRAPTRIPNRRVGEGATVAGLTHNHFPVAGSPLGLQRRAYFGMGQPLPPTPVRRGQPRTGRSFALRSRQNSWPKA